MWNRRDWGRACASAVLAAGLPAVGSSQTRRIPRTGLQGSPLVIAVHNRSSLNYLPLTIAERLGYFAAEGIQVEMREYAGIAQSLQALAEDEAQVVSGPYASIMQLHQSGQSLQSFVLQGRAPQIVLGVSQRALPDFRSLRALQGKRIGVDALDSAPHKLARMLAARAGLLNSDIQYVALPSAAAAVEEFRAGRIEAICYSDLAITQLERAGDLRVVVDTRTVQGNVEVFGGPWPSGCLSAPRGFLTDQPQHCQALANAMVHALKWLQTAGPSDINKMVPEWYFYGDRGLYLAAFSRAREAWAPDGLMPEKGPETVVRNLAQLPEGAGLRTLDLGATFTNEFALKAKAKFRA
jgi:NitT/TauT family transport system substrate-binding protein